MTKAKVEISAWMNNAVRRAGLERLMQREEAPLQLEHDDKDKQ